MLRKIYVSGSIFEKCPYRAALTSHFESFWSIVQRKEDENGTHVKLEEFNPILIKGLGLASKYFFLTSYILLSVVIKVFSQFARD